MPAAFKERTWSAISEMSGDTTNVKPTCPWALARSARQRAGTW